MTETIMIIGGLVVAFVAAFIGAVISKKISQKGKDNAEQQIKVLLDEADKNASSIKRDAELSAKDYLLKARTEFEKETKQTRREVQDLEKASQERQSKLDKKYDSLQSREGELQKLSRDAEANNQKVEELKEKYGHLVEESKQELENISGLSKDEAKRELMSSMEEEAKHEATKLARQIEEDARQEAEGKAKKIITFAIERMAGEWVQERSVSTVSLPSDDMKGRIIGKEGRNIRCLEAATGVDLVIDDTPGAVVLSSHNPVRREVARKTLEQLLADGRIHPARIEELTKKSAKEVEESIRDAGQKALFELEIHGVHPEIIKLLGALKYRYSYAQNVLQHSLEVGFLAGMIASELGLDPKLARRAGLMHDIGKAISHEIPGSHAVVGGQFAKKYGEVEDVYHPVWAHHEDIPQVTHLDNIVSAADALSGARPGARMEQTESYVKRLEDLEKIATSFEHVEKAFGIQAGRELRVMVTPGKVTDEKAYSLCKEISRKIEDELTYPGQIKVMVIRETRATSYAK